MSQLKIGVVISYVSIILHNLIGILFVPFLIHKLGQHEYGLFSLVSSLVASLTIMDLGFSNAIVRYTSKFRVLNQLDEQYKMFGMFFVLYSIIAVITLFIGYGIYLNIDSIFNQTMSGPDFEKLRVMVVMLFFNLAFTFFMSIWGAVITAYEEFIFQKLVNLIRIVLNPIVMLCFLYMGYKAIAMVVIISVFNILTLSINAFYCLFKIRIKVKFAKFNWGFLKGVSMYSFWIFLTAIIDKIYWNSGQVILGIFVGTDAVAIFAIAMQFVIIYLSFSTVITGVFLPKVTGMIAKNASNKEVSDLFIKTGRIQYIVMAFILSGFVLFGRQFILLWVGNGYQEVYTIVLIFFISLLVPTIQNLGVTILQARNQMKFRSLSFFVISIFGLCFSVLFSKIYGAIGCACAIALLFIIGQVIIMNIYYKICIHIDIVSFWKEIFKISYIPLPIIIFGTSYSAYYNFDSFISLAIAILVFSILYISLFFFTSMNTYERNLFIVPLKKLISICYR